MKENIFSLTIPETSAKWEDYAPGQFGDDVQSARTFKNFISPAAEFAVGAFKCLLP